MKITDRFIGDHKTFRKLLDEIHKLADAGPTRDAKRLTRLVMLLIDHIVIHSWGEDRFFYPVIRENLAAEYGAGVTPAYMDVMDAEHVVIDQALSRLESEVDRDPKSDGWVPAFETVRAELTAHMGKEERELFPFAERRLGTAALDSISIEIERRRREAPAVRRYEERRTNKGGPMKSMRFGAIVAVLGILAWGVGATPVAAGPCDVLIEGTDDMRFTRGNGKETVKKISVPASCEEVTVTLRHIGNLPKAIMGHNWVLAEEANWKALAADAAKATKTDYVPPDDPRVLAATSLIGGREQTKVTFSLAKLSAEKAYAFFCSFPGHWRMMNGRFVIKES